MARTVIGLEITEESVRAAELSTGRVPQLLSYGEVPLPPDAAKDSEVIDAGAVAVALRQLWTGARLKGKRVVLGVASRRILVREYSTQALRPDLLRDALPYQVQDLLPVPASQAVLDFFPLSQEGDRVSGLLVAAVSETIEQMIGALDRVKLRVDSVDLTAFGLARLSTIVASPEKTIAIVYIGDHTTQVVIARGGVPQFVRLLPIDVPTQAVQSHQALPIVPEPSLSTGDSTGPTTRVRGAQRASQVSSVSSDLAARLRSTLAFFASRPDAAPVSQVLLAGAGAVTSGMVDSISAAIDSLVRVLTATDVVSVHGSTPEGDTALNLVSTIGLALGEAR